jgi:hypothetical protein
MDGDPLSTDTSLHSGTALAYVLNTGFETADGWDLGHSICGDEFGLGLTCNYPVTNVCIPKNHPASQNCCFLDTNEETGWFMSGSSRHCSEPSIRDVHPFAGTQHLRFQYDPAGGRPAGCNGFGSACRQAAFFTDRGASGSSPSSEIAKTTFSMEIAGSATLGSTLVWGVTNYQPPAVSFNTYGLFYYYGGIYQYDFITAAFVFGGYWSDNSPGYANFTVVLDPCNDKITYSYAGVVFHVETYGFTPPYGGPSDARSPTTDSGIYLSDHYGETWDIDNQSYVYENCPDACCDGNTGICTDGVAAVDCSGLGKHYYPNIYCSQLGTAGFPPVCALDKGSCCDTSPRAGGSCADGVLESACSGAQRIWVRGGSCADVAGSCNVGAFCYEGTCTPAALPGHCEYASAGFCQGMGSCVGGPTCNPDTGAGCCDNGCTPPILCPSGIAADCVGKADCDAVPRGADCAFCEGCDPWPTVLCATAADCPSPGAGLPQGTCVPNPPVGCNGDADCPAGQTPCIIPVMNRGWTLCQSDAECSIAASVCLETPGACCEQVKGTCVDDVLAGDCQEGTPLQLVWFKGESCADLEADGRCEADLGACCDRDPFGGCTNTTFNGCPTDGTKNVWTKGILCANIECTHDAIPTVSAWGLVVLTLLLLTGAKIYFGRRQAAAA